MLSQGDNADYLRSQLKQLSFQRAFSSATGMGTQQGDWQEQASRTTDNQQFQISRGKFGFVIQIVHHKKCHYLGPFYSDFVGCMLLI